MAIRIYKYPIPAGQFPSVGMPVGAKILDVQIQNDIPTVWAIIDTEAKLETVQFTVFATGDDLPKKAFSLKYIGTYQFGKRQELVWHLFRNV